MTTQDGDTGNGGVVADDVAKQKRVRGGHKAHLTKLLKDVSDKLTDYTEEREAKVLTLKASLERKSAVLRKLDAEILDAIEDPVELTNEIETTEVLQNDIQESIIKIEKMMKKEITIEDVKPVLLGGGTRKKTMKLPKYQVSDFHGDPKKWRAFRDAFEVAAMQNEELEEVEKFHYLRGYLKGSALLAVEGLQVTKENNIIHLVHI